MPLRKNETKQTARVLELLKRFNRGEKICIDGLTEEAKNLENGSLWWNESTKKPMTERNIKRDFNLIKEYFPTHFEMIRGAKDEKSCYKAMTKDMFNNILNNDVMAIMVQIFNMSHKNRILEDMALSNTDQRILTQKIKTSHECYQFVSKPFESKKGDTNILATLEDAITNTKYVKLDYLDDTTTKHYQVEPLKIVFINENFYLACKNKEYFSMYRLIYIQKVEIIKGTFKEDYKMLDYIKMMQTPRGHYDVYLKRDMIKVVVEVAKTKAKYFKAKKHLASQITKQNEDGTLNVSFRVTHYDEIKDFIKSWIPYIKVIEPLGLKDEIESDLRKYLSVGAK